MQPLYCPAQKHTLWHAALASVTLAAASEHPKYKMFDSTMGWHFVSKSLQILMRITGTKTTLHIFFIFDCSRVTSLLLPYNKAYPGTVADRQFTTHKLALLVIFVPRADLVVYSNQPLLCITTAQLSATRISANWHSWRVCMSHIKAFVWS